MKFKIGDHVEIVNDESLVDEYEVGDTAFVIGWVYDYTVIAMEEDGIPQIVMEDDIEYITDDDDAFFTTTAKNDGKKLIAVIVDGNKITVSDGDTTSVAECSSKDVFDEQFGTKLALERYYEKTKKFPQVGDTYYWVDADGSVQSDEYDGWDYEKPLVVAGNCFKTKEEAEAKAKKFREVLAH